MHVNLFMTHYRISRHRCSLQRAKDGKGDAGRGPGPRLFGERHPLRRAALEERIRHCPVATASYAMRVLEDHWPEAEETIAQDPQAAAMYVSTGIRNGWLEGEEPFSSNELLGQHWREIMREEHGHGPEEGVVHATP